MKTTRYLVIVPIIALLAWIGVSSVDDPDGPHNGKIKSAGDYRIEAGHTNTEIFAYLYDKNMGEIPNKGITCTAVFEFPDNTVGNLDLVPYGKYSFKALMIDRDYQSCVITFAKGADSISAKYDNIIMFPPMADK